MSDLPDQSETSLPSLASSARARIMSPQAATLALRDDNEFDGPRATKFSAGSSAISPGFFAEVVDSSTQILRLPRITPQDMQRQTRARVAEFRRLNHIRGPEANSKSFTTIVSGSHRISLPEGSGLKRQVAEQDLKLAEQFFAVLQNVMKTCNDLDATEQKFLDQVNQLWNQDFGEIIRQSIGAMANATRRQQDTLVSKCKYWSSVRLAAGSELANEPAIFDAAIKLMARMMEERFRVASHMFLTQRTVVRAQWELLEQHALEMKNTLPMLDHLVQNYYEVSKQFPKPPGKTVFKDKIDSMLHSLFVEFPHAKSHDAWAAIVWFMLAMGYSDVMPLSMLQHVQMNLDEYRGNGKKSKKSLGDEFEEKINPGDEESEIRAQVKLWEENSDVHDLTRQAVDLFVDDVRLARALQSSVSERTKCQDTSSRTMFQKLDFIASRLTSMPKGTRLPVSYAPILQYFETEITQDAHILNADIERLEKEKIRLTILIRKLDARLKSLVTQDAARIVPLADLQEYMKFCQSGPSSLPKNSKVAQIARSMQKSPVGSPMRGRSPSIPDSPVKSPVGHEVPSLAIDDESQLGIEEQRQFLLHSLITGFKFAKEVIVSPRKSFAGIDDTFRGSPDMKRNNSVPVFSDASYRDPILSDTLVDSLQKSADAEFMGNFKLDGGRAAVGNGAAGCGGKEEDGGSVSLALSDLVSSRPRLLASSLQDANASAAADADAPPASAAADAADAADANAAALQSNTSPDTTAAGE